MGRVLRTLLIFAPVLLLAVLQAPALDFGFVWMDETEIVAGEIVLPPGRLGEAFTRPLHVGGAGAGGERNPYYRPLQIVWASALHAAFGPAPRAFHAASLAAGAVCVLAFTLLARGLLGSALLAAFAGALVAAHPAGLEAWTWVSGVAEPLSALAVTVSFGAALLCTARPAGAGRPSGQPPRGGRAAWGALSVLALGAALLVKEKAAVTPALLAAAWAASRIAASSPPGSDPAPAQTGGAPVGLLAPLAGRSVAALLGAQVLVLAAWALLLRPAAVGGGLALAAPIGGSAASHLGSALAAWPREIGWLAAPLHPTTSDSVAIVAAPTHPLALLGVGLAALSLAGFFALARARRPVAALGLAWLWIAFLPTASLLPQIHARADRYLFLSSFGLALCVADALGAFGRGGSSRRRTVAVAGGVALLLSLAARTATRLPDWHSTRSLFAADVARDESFLEGRHHLARALHEASRFEDAERHLGLLRAAMQAPRRASYVNRAGAVELACQNRLALGRPREVEALLEEAARGRPGLARLPSLRVCSGQALERLGRGEEALAVYLELAAELGDEAPPRLALLVAARQIEAGRPEEARVWIARAESAARQDPALGGEILRLRSRLSRTRDAPAHPRAPGYR